MTPAQAAMLLTRPKTATGELRAADAAIELAEPAGAFPPEFVHRPALVSRLLAGKAGLTLVVAPAGYGKSSLLRDWQEQDERPFVWLRIASGSDGDPLGSLIWPPSARSACVVVLDDAHLLGGSVLPAIVEGVLSDLPQGSTLVLAARSELNLPLGRLRVHRQVTELRTTDLAMTPSEAARLLELAGREIRPSAVQELVVKTEGWAAALYLAGLSAQADPDAGEFGGANHLISEYLRDEVFAGLSPELISFAQRTSILDEVSGDVCDRVLDTSGTGLMLAELARDRPLLMPVDGTHREYRWHPLVRESLQSEFHCAEPRLELDLHRRASRLFASRGDTDRAIKHAAGAGDARQVETLLWPKLTAYATNGRAAQVVGWTEELGEDRLSRRTRLAVCVAHAHLWNGDLDLAMRWARLGDSETEDPETEPAVSDPALEEALGVISAAGARGAKGMRDAAAGALEAQHATSQWRPMCLALRGISEHLLGDRASAAALLESAADLAGAAQAGVAALCKAQRSMIAMEESDWALAEELSDAAGAMVVDHQLTGDPLMALVYAACAASRARQGRSDEAKADLRAGIDRLAWLGDSIPWYGAETRIMLAHASLALADVIGARTLLAQASRLARRTSDATVFTGWFDEAWAQMDTIAESSLAGPSALTIAELRILRFLPTHRSFREIGNQLGVSANTVKTQAHAIYRKLGVASRSEAVDSAIAAGLLGQ